MKCERCGKINPAEIHTCTPEPQVNGWPLYSGLPQRNEPEPVMLMDAPLLLNGQPLYTAPPQRERVQFPTMLRKMWSGTEVQAWLDENVNQENNNE